LKVLQGLQINIRLNPAVQTPMAPLVSQPTSMADAYDTVALRCQRATNVATNKPCGAENDGNLFMRIILHGSFGSIFRRKTA
jgi:hypothetical protein